jgi:hypothetical protein
VQDPDAELSVYIVIFSLIEIIRSILFLFKDDIVERSFVRNYFVIDVFLIILFYFSDFSIAF